ncbi:MAG: glycosyltransferase [Gaiellaceae bacterium]
MRVALISNTLPPEGKGGAEAYVADLGTALARTNDVLVLTGATRNATAPFSVARLPGLPPLPSEATLSQKTIWHARDQWRPATYFAALHILRRFQPDVVHTNECQGLSAAVFTALERLRIPHVHMAHDLNLLCVRVSMTRDGQFCGGRCRMCQIQRAIRGGAVRRHTNRLVSVSRYIEQRHLAAGVISPERSTIVRLGVHVERRAQTIRKEGLFTIGFIGSVSRFKGILTLLEAFESIPDTDWRLIVAGSGECEVEVADAVVRDGRISYLGYVSDARKNVFYDGIDVLAVPSEWEEPAALVAIEASARAIPLVVSDRGGLNELPEACLFRSGDAIALASQLNALQKDSERRQAISTRLLERHEEFTWERHFREMFSVLQEVSDEA